MSISSVNSSVQGIQRGLQNLNKAAQDTASANISGDQDAGTLVESATKAKQAELQVSASAAALKADDEARGALLDVLA